MTELQTWVHLGILAFQAVTGYLLVRHGGRIKKIGKRLNDHENGGK